MSMMVWLLVAVPVALGVAGAATAGVVVRARRRRPLSRQETLVEAAKAARELRRSGPRRHRDTFERGHGVPDRHSAAILENSVYGDAADFGPGGSDGGGGSDGSGGSY
ncbi:MAG: hypothetical protein WA890_29225 [Micromonospora sp.]